MWYEKKRVENKRVKYRKNKERWDEKYRGHSGVWKKRTEGRVCKDEKKKGIDRWTRRIMAYSIRRTVY